MSKDKQEPQASASASSQKRAPLRVQPLRILYRHLLLMFYCTVSQSARRCWFWAAGWRACKRRTRWRRLAWTTSYWSRARTNSAGARRAPTGCTAWSSRKTRWCRSRLPLRWTSWKHTSTTTTRAPLATPTASMPMPLCATLRSGFLRSSLNDRLILLFNSYSALPRDGCGNCTSRAFTYSM